MDSLQQALAAYAHDAPDELADDVSTAIGHRLLDSIGVALDGRTEPAVAAVTRYVEQVEGYGGGGHAARLWGTTTEGSTRAALLVNGASLRARDYNDAVYSRVPGRWGMCHPSDMIPGLVAAAERVDATGQALASAIAVSYEVAVSLVDSVPVLGRGWDHVTTTGLAATCGIGRLLGLDVDELGHAIAISATSNVTMRQVRAGQSGLWRAIAAAYAVDQALVACQMAEAGATGPVQPFEGRWGLIANLSEEPEVDWTHLESIHRLDAPTKVLDTHLKRWPIGYLGQGVADVCARVSPRIAGGEGLAHATIATFAKANEIMGAPDRWPPQTREAADHSLLFVAAAALRFGRLTKEMFDEDSPVFAELVAFADDHVRLEVDPAFSDRYPDEQPARVTVVTTTGETFSEEADSPLGHVTNPMSPDDVVNKFSELATDTLGDRVEAVVSAVADLAGLDRVATLTRLLEPV